MHRIYSNQIIQEPNTPTDDGEFLLPEAKLVMPEWSASIGWYANGEEELEAFLTLQNNLLARYGRAHIYGIGTEHTLAYLREQAHQSSAYQSERNTYAPNWETEAVSIGVYLTDVLYSTKDAYQKDTPKNLIGKLRTPRDQKAIRAAINAGLVACVHLPTEAGVTDEYKKMLITQWLTQEDTAVLTMGRVLGWNAVACGLAKEVQYHAIHIPPYDTDVA